MAPPLLSFAGAAAATSVQALLLGVEVHKSSRYSINRAYEHKFRALRWGRTAVYAVLVLCQVGTIGQPPGVC
jgi:hypothetical protein